MPAKWKWWRKAWFGSEPWSLHLLLQAEAFPTIYHPHHMYHVHPRSFQNPLTTSMINDRKNNWASKERDRGRKMTGKPERGWGPKDLYQDTRGIVQSSVCLFFIYLSLFPALSLFLSPSPGIFLSLWPSGKVSHSQSRIQGAAKARGPRINTSFAGRDLLSFTVSNSSDVEKKRNRIWWKTTHMAFNFPDIWKLFRGHGLLRIPSGAAKYA